MRLIDEWCPDCPVIAIKREWGRLQFSPAETVLDAEPPMMLLEAIKRVYVHLAKKEHSKGVLKAVA